MTPPAPPPERGLHQLLRSVAAGTWVLPFLTLGISVLVARALGPEGRGAYGVVVATIAVVPVVLTAGFEYAVRYWTARGEVERPAILKAATVLALGVGALAGGLVLASWSADWPGWLVPPSLGVVGAGALAATLLLTPLKAVWVNYWVGFERYGWTIWGPVAATAVQLAVLAAWAAFRELSLDAAVVAFGVQMAVTLALFVALARNDLGRAARAPALPAREMRGMLRYGLWQYLSVLLMQINLRGIVYLLAALSTLHETGLFTAVLGPAGFLYLLAAPLGHVLSARTTRRTGDASFPLRVASALRVVVAVSLAAAVAAAVVAPALLVAIFGERFRAGVPVFWILLPGVVAFSPVRVVSQYLAGAKRPEWNTTVSAVGAAITLGLSALWVPSLGAVGAALATTTAQIVSGAVAAGAFLRVSGLRLGDLLVPHLRDWEPVGQVVGLPLRRRMTS